MTVSVQIFPGQASCVFCLGSAWMTAEMSPCSPMLCGKSLAGSGRGPGSPALEIGASFDVGFSGKQHRLWRLHAGLQRSCYPAKLLPYLSRGGNQPEKKLGMHLLQTPKTSVSPEGSGPTSNHPGFAESCGNLQQPVPTAPTLQNQKTIFEQSPDAKSTVVGPLKFPSQSHGQNRTWLMSWNVPDSNNFFWNGDNHILLCRKYPTITPAIIIFVNRQWNSNRSVRAIQWWVRIFLRKKRSIWKKIITTAHTKLHWNGWVNLQK